MPGKKKDKPKGDRFGHGRSHEEREEETSGFTEDEQKEIRQQTGEWKKEHGGG